MTLDAQPIALTSTVPDVAVATYGSPGFTQAVTKLGVGQATSQLGSAANYLVVLTVTGARPISSIRLLYLIKDTHHTSRQIRILEPVDLRPGDSLLTAPIPWGQTAAAITKHAIPPFPPQDVLAGKTITVSVDSVTHSDGTFSGPDTLNFFDRLKARDSQVAEFFTELLQLSTSSDSDTALLLWLKSRAVQPAPSHGPQDIDFAGTSVFKQASAALDTLQSGRTALTQFANQGVQKHSGIGLQREGQ